MYCRICGVKVRGKSDLCPQCRAVLERSSHDCYHPDISKPEEPARTFKPFKSVYKAGSRPFGKRSQAGLLCYIVGIAALFSDWVSCRSTYYFPEFSAQETHTLASFGSSLLRDIRGIRGSYLQDGTVDMAMALVCLALLLGFAAVLAPFLSSSLWYVRNRMKGRKDGFLWCTGLSGACFVLSGICGAAAVLQLNAFMHSLLYHDTFFKIKEGPVLLIVAGAAAIIASAVQRRKCA